MCLKCDAPRPLITHGESSLESHIGYSLRIRISIIYIVYVFEGGVLPLRMATDDAMATVIFL